VIRPFSLFLFGLLSSPVLAGSVEVSIGDVIFNADDGSSRSLTSTHDAREAVLSPDGRRVAWVKDPALPDETEPSLDAPDLSTLWLSDVDGSSARLLVDSKPADEPKENLTAFNSLAFTLDGKGLYFLTQGWVTSNALHLVGLASGKVRYIADANTVQVVPKGKYANHLIVQKHKYRKGGGSYESYWLIAPSGKEIREIGESEEKVEELLR